MDDLALKQGGSPAPLIGAALAAQVSIMVAPLPGARIAPDLVWGVLMLAPLSLLALGVWRRAPGALLGGVPVGWGLAAFLLPAGAWTPTLIAVSLCAAGAYLVAALLWCRPVEGEDAEGLEITWSSLSTEPKAPGLRPWLGLWLVAGPPVGALLWRDCLAGAYAGYPQSPGLAQVGLILLGLLVGLAIASDLLRGRLPRRPRKGRAALMAMAGALCLVAYGLTR